MTVNLIAAVGKSGQLGLGGKIPWSDPHDLYWFAQMTMGHVVVLGKRTLDGIPRVETEKLPGRRLWIVNRENCACRSPEEIIDLHRGAEIWVAGGEFVYRQWMPYIRRAYITMADYDGPADVWMPQLWKPWQ